MPCWHNYVGDPSLCGAPAMSLTWECHLNQYMFNNNNNPKTRGESAPNSVTGSCSTIIACLFPRWVTLPNLDGNLGLRAWLLPQKHVPPPDALLCRIWSLWWIKWHWHTYGESSENSAPCSALSFPGHSKSWKVAQINWISMTFYQWSIVNIHIAKFQIYTAIDSGLKKR